MITVGTLTVVLKCDCHNTQTMAKVENGKLVIEGVHHSSFHKISVPLDILLAVCNDSGATQKKK